MTQKKIPVPKPRPTAGRRASNTEITSGKLPKGGSWFTESYDHRPKKKKK